MKREKNNSIPWQSIKGMRNRIVHDYGFLNSEIVKNVIMNSIPNLYLLILESYNEL